jgi:hypothetical protein
MVHPPGTYPLMADATGYSTWAAMVSVDEATTVTKNVSMTKSGNGGTCAAVGSAEASTLIHSSMESPRRLNFLVLLILPIGVALLRKLTKRKNLGKRLQ